MHLKLLAVVALASLAGYHGEGLAGGRFECSAERLPHRVLKVVQQSLTQAGFDPGREDGVYSDTTFKALVAYARRRHHTADKDLAMIKDLLTDTVGPEEAQKLMPHPPEIVAGPLGCAW